MNMKDLIQLTVLAILTGYNVLHGQRTLGCEKITGAFCWSLNSPCPSGYTVDQAHSNFYGCGRVDRQCCVKQDSFLTGVRSRDVCGLGSVGLVSDDRILNGGPTGSCDWPFVVSIRGRNSLSIPLSYDTSTHACAGVLIDSQWVLTSPFCVLSAGLSLSEVPDRVLVVAGEFNVTGLDLDPVTQGQQEEVMEVTGAYFEPRYRFTSQLEAVPFLQDTKAINSHAVALLRLKNPIKGRCSGVACLPTDDETMNDCASYTQCVTLGWGYNRPDFQGIDDTLLRGRVRLTSRTACDLLTTRLGVEQYRPNGTICQSPSTNINTDSCLGDEGGPVLCAEGGQWVVRAVLPFNLCRQDNYQLWLTELAGYMDWVKATITAA